MWLRISPSRSADLGDVLELVERDERSIRPALLEAQRQVEQGVERRERIDLRPELELRADPVGAEREPDAGLLKEVLDPAPDRALQLPRVRALEADRDVRDRRHAIQVDEDRDQRFLLAVAQRPPQQAGLPVLAGAESRT